MSVNPVTKKEPEGLEWDGVFRTISDRPSPAFLQILDNIERDLLGLPRKQPMTLSAWLAAHPSVKSKVGLTENYMHVELPEPSLAGELRDARFEDFHCLYAGLEFTFVNRNHYNVPTEIPTA